METIEDRVKRLPKWVREHITHLERARLSAENELDRFKGKIEEEPGFSGNVALDGLGIRQRLILHDRSRVVFFGTGKGWKDRIVVHIDDNNPGHIGVYGGDSLVIRPMSSNGVRISTGRIE